jgi:hypothetical protein
VDHHVIHSSQHDLAPRSPDRWPRPIKKNKTHGKISFPSSSLQLLAQRIAFKAHTQRRIFFFHTLALGESPRTPCALPEFFKSGNAETRRHRSNSIAAYALLPPAPVLAVRQFPLVTMGRAAWGWRGEGGTSVFSCIGLPFVVVR